jgi:phenylacetate-CoA ligase
LVERVHRAIRDELFFRAEVRSVSPGTLPRFEHKARRVVKKS